jgi:hypothetical protein
VIRVTSLTSELVDILLPMDELEKEYGASQQDLDKIEHFAQQLRAKAKWPSRISRAKCLAIFFVFTTSPTARPISQAVRR